jgi:hypothetical protein
VKGKDAMLYIVLETTTVLYGALFFLEGVITKHPILMALRVYFQIDIAPWDSAEFQPERQTA